jgi:hypothetical protein
MTAKTEKGWKTITCPMEGCHTYANKQLKEQKSSNKQLIQTKYTAKNSGTAPETNYYNLLNLLRLVVKHLS